MQEAGLIYLWISSFNSQNNPMRQVFFILTVSMCVCIYTYIIRQQQQKKTDTHKEHVTHPKSYCLWMEELEATSTRHCNWSTAGNYAGPFHTRPVTQCLPLCPRAGKQCIALSARVISWVPLITCCKAFTHYLGEYSEREVWTMARDMMFKMHFTSPLCHSYHSAYFEELR